MNDYPASLEVIFGQQIESPSHRFYRPELRLKSVANKISHDSLTNDPEHGPKITPPTGIEPTPHPIVGLRIKISAL